jgi:hypothetical protein
VAVFKGISTENIATAIKWLRIQKKLYLSKQNEQLKLYKSSRNQIIWLVIKNIKIPTIFTEYLQDLRAITGSVPGKCNKVNIAIKQVTQFFGFPVHRKVMFALYCIPISVQ